MTAALPRGLLNANPVVQQYAFDDADVDFTNSEALHKFWKGTSFPRIIDVSMELKNAQYTPFKVMLLKMTEPRDHGICFGEYGAVQA